MEKNIRLKENNVTMFIYELINKHLKLDGQRINTKRVKSLIKWVSGVRHDCCL